MFKRARHLVFILALGASAGCATYETASDARDVQAIKAIQRDWLRASLAGDRATLERILHPEFVSTSAIGEVRKRAAVINAPPVGPAATQFLHQLDVRIYGTTAVATGVIIYRAHPRSEERQVPFTDVYVQADGRWQVVASQVTIRSRPRDRTS